MNGFVAINKKCGLSSSDVVIKCRNSYSHKIGHKIKCGHMGTLDPAASGILLLGFGKATRLFDLMQNKLKTYIANITFGIETDTLDREGKIVNKSNLPNFSKIPDVIKSFIGNIEQIPPKYSAISIDGKRSYDLARSGVEFELKARKIFIENIEILKYDLDNELCKELTIKITCSSGTYIRSLVRDIAYRLNVVGYMSSLDRISLGFFDKSNSVDMDIFLEDPIKYVIPTIDVLQKMLPIYEVEPQHRRKVINGVKCHLNDDMPQLCVLTIDNKLFGIGETKDGLTKSVVNLWEEI